MPGDEDQDWFVPVERRPGAAARLFVLPHAGAGPAAVAAFGAAVRPDIEVWALNLPGRQARQAEPPRTDLAGLTADLAAWLRRRDPRPYALFGYCGGALLAYLVAEQCAPTHLFVGSQAAPDVALIPRRLHALPGERFWEVVLDQGGVAPELAELVELRPVFEPAIRADFELYAGYRRHGGRLDVPVTVLFGREDRALGRGALLGWRRRTTGRLRLADLPGGHWLLDDATAETAALVGDTVLAGLATPAGVS
ncbi:thioesterase II family protein [Kutzneria kofuensis]|uniref:thioesterase II family protein n=1 Tax=Kutzneria kofuensis TaxID=103725 RepID=UPI0031E9014E